MTDHYGDLPLGKELAYPEHYDPMQLVAIERQAARAAIAVDSVSLPFFGEDIWK